MHLWFKIFLFQNKEIKVKVIIVHALKKIVVYIDFLKLFLGLSGLFLNMAPWTFQLIRATLYKSVFEDNFSLRQICITENDYIIYELNSIGSSISLNWPLNGPQTDAGSTKWPFNVKHRTKSIFVIDKYKTKLRYVQ